MPGRLEAAQSEASLKWAFDETRAKQPPEVSVESAEEILALVDTAWRDLLRDHLAFHEPPEGVRARLLSAVRDVESAFLESGYNGHRYYEDLYLESAPQSVLSIDIRLSYLVLTQARVMEDACEALQLYRYANAPSNRGFMNLFRRWGNSLTFNAGFDNIRDLLTRRFVRFYDDYVRARPEGIDLDPVPHPWDPPETRPQTPLDHEELAWDLLVDAHSIEGRTEDKVVPGVFLDSGIFDASSVRPPTETPQASGAVSKEGHAAEQQDDHSGGPSRGVPNT